MTALAQSHQIASQGFSESEAANLGTGSIVIKVGGGSEKRVTIDADNSSLEGIKNAINSAKVGVTATIVNDGSVSNPYRLILSADKTGAKNKITISSNLTGAKQMDFSGSSFDQVEKTSFSPTATSTPTLGATASYTGSQNKTYTFTVGGTGTQTVGQGDIQIDWTDGTNSGTVIVSSADTEVELIGGGADGLKLQFGAGTLVAGDTFQVQTFSPLLQAAQDAKLSVGSASGGGSPITVTSETNFVKDLIAGVTLNLKKVSGDELITINIEQDTSLIEERIDSFIQKFNDVIASIDEQFKFDPNNVGKTGSLFGDRTLMMLQSSLRGAVTSRISGIDSQYTMLAAIGIRMGATGKLAVVDRSKLQAAIKDNVSDVQKLFAASGSSSNSKITFLALGPKTIPNDAGYEVQITQAAKRGYLQGTSVGNPSQVSVIIGANNKNLVLKIDGILSDNITLTEKSYTSWQELADELQSKIKADTKVGHLGVEVGFVDNGSDGYLTLSSGTYGTTSKVELQSGTSDSAATTLGLVNGRAFSGQNVEGTINGEQATGIGRILTGNEGNATTAGLKLQVDLTDAEIGEGAEAVVTVFRGIASRVQQFADSVTKSIDGTLARRTTAIQKQFDDINGRIGEMNKLMEMKRLRLMEKFIDMETTLGQLESQSQYLNVQLQQIALNFSQILTNNRRR